jgi:hypothetical protein
MEANEKNVTFNLKQAAAYLGINPYTLLGALNRNEIPHQRIGKRWVSGLTAIWILYTSGPD